MPDRFRSNPPGVALLTEATSSYARGVLSGVARYAQMHGPWDFVRHFYSHRTSDADAIRSIAAWTGDGILAHVRATDMAEVLATKGTPTVNVSGLLDAPDLPLVTVDNLAVGRLAAEHFAERGFDRVGFLGFPSHVYSRLRRDGFTQSAEERGLTCVSPEVDPDADVHRPLLAEETWRAWLAGLRKPVGVFAANDRMAQKLLGVCRDEGWRVPGDVAILGCDDDELVWGFVNPPLSSIDIGAERIGHEAARLLDGLMSGQSPPDAPVLIPPRGVVARQSSDVFAADDPVVAEALRYIQHHATNPVSVEDVADAVLVGRRTLELRFASCMDLTPVRRHPSGADRPRQNPAHLDQPTHARGRPPQRSQRRSAALDRVPPGHRKHTHGLPPHRSWARRLGAGEARRLIDSACDAAAGPGRPARAVRRRRARGRGRGRSR